jgi:hypothetical protein
LMREKRKRKRFVRTHQAPGQCKRVLKLILHGSLSIGLSQSLRETGKNAAVPSGSLLCKEPCTGGSATHSARGPAHSGADDWADVQSAASAGGSANGSTT